MPGDFLVYFTQKISDTHVSEFLDYNDWLAIWERYDDGPPPTEILSPAPGSPLPTVPPEFVAFVASNAGIFVRCSCNKASCHILLRGQLSNSYNLFNVVSLVTRKTVIMEADKSTMLAVLQLLRKYNFKVGFKSDFKEKLLHNLKSDLINELCNDKQRMNEN